MDPNLLIFFYSVISVSVVIIVLVFCVVGFYVVQTLKKAQIIIDKSALIVSDVRTLQHSIELGALSNILKIFKIFSKKEVTHG